MSKPHEPHRIYRALLHLYPKSHRQAYGRQMVQTLDDILSEQQSKYERFTVWLRVIYELPINIIEENFNSMGEISVNKLTKVSNRQLVYAALAILVIGSYAATATIWRHQRAVINSLNSQLQTVTKNQFAMYGGSYTDVTIIPSEETVYMPLAKIKLSATTLTERLVYNYKSAGSISGDKKVFSATLSISTHDLSVNNYGSAQFDCSEVAYADFVTPSYPINPKYKSNGSIKLADGRTMNIYYAPSIPGCEAAWKMNSINTKTIADSLKQAVSY